MKAEKTYSEADPLAAWAHGAKKQQSVETERTKEDGRSLAAATG